MRLADEAVVNDRPRIKTKDEGSIDEGTTATQAPRLFSLLPLVKTIMRM